MRKRIIAVGAAAVAAGVAAIACQPAAFASPSASTSPSPTTTIDTEPPPATSDAPVAALTEGPVAVHAGDTVPVTLGIGNISKKRVNGITVWIRTVDPVDLPQTFSNCTYYVASNEDGAFCEFSTKLAPGKKYKVDAFSVTLAKTATKADSVVFALLPSATPAQIEKVIKQENGENVTAGSGGATTLVAADDLTVPDKPSTIGFAGLKFIATTWTSSSPVTANPSGSATSSAPAGAVPSSSSSSNGSGLPLTGSAASTAAAIGGGLIVLGAGGYFLTRRRRRTFTA